MDKHICHANPIMRFLVGSMNVIVWLVLVFYIREHYTNHEYVKACIDSFVAGMWSVKIVFDVMHRMASDTECM